MNARQRGERAARALRRASARTAVVAIASLIVVAGLALWATNFERPAQVQGAPALHEPAPDVRLTDFEGTRFALSDYRGTPVVLNFWASWCPFCAAEMPDFERVHRSVRDTVAFVGIDQCETCAGGSRAAADRLVEETGVTYRLAEDPDGSVYVAFGGTSMPTTVFIDADGRVVDHVGGMLSEDQLRDRIRRLFGVDDA